MQRLGASRARMSMILAPLPRITRVLLFRMPATIFAAASGAEVDLTRVIVSWPARPSSSLRSGELRKICVETGPGYEGDGQVGLVQVHPKGVTEPADGELRGGVEEPASSASRDHPGSTG